METRIFRGVISQMLDTNSTLIRNNMVKKDKSKKIIIKMLIINVII